MIVCVSQLLIEHEIVDISLRQRELAVTDLFEGFPFGGWRRSQFGECVADSTHAAAGERGGARRRTERVLDLPRVIGEGGFLAHSTRSGEVIAAGMAMGEEEDKHRGERVYILT